jgi:hypothetical protein
VGQGFYFWGHFKEPDERMINSSFRFKSRCPNVAFSDLWQTTSLLSIRLPPWESGSRCSMLARKFRMNFLINSLPQEFPSCSEEQIHMNDYHLTHNGEKWALKREGAKRATEVFSDATKQEAIRQAADRLADSGASMKIHKLDGRIQEERTYPRSADPRSSHG